MDLIVNPSPEITGEITPSPSKFYTQYATALGLLAEGKTLIKSPLLVDDTRNLMKAIESLGGTTKRSKKKWNIWGEGGSLHPEGQELDAKKSLMSMSLLASLSTLTSRIMVITGNKQVRSPPVPSLINSLQRLGVDIHSTKSDESPPLVTFQSEIRGGKISFDKDEIDSSLHFFIPAVLLLTPFPDEGVELQLTPELESRFLESSIELMEKSGIDIEKDEQKLKVGGGEFNPIEVTPPLDIFSTLPYVTGAILTESELKIEEIDKGVDTEDFENLLGNFGINLKKEDNALKIPAGQNLKATKMDLGEYSNFLPFFAVLASAAEGETQIVNASSARRMKSDRIETIVEGLGKMGVDITENEDGVIVKGPSDLKGGVVNGYNDVAIVGALGAAGLTAEGTTIIKNRAEALRQSYPQFVTVFKDLGADMGYES